MSNRFDIFVNKILTETLQGGKISSLPIAMQGVGAINSNIPPSSQPQITSSKPLPKSTIPTTPKILQVQINPKDQEIKNEIAKLPQDAQQKLASANTVDDITTAIANIDPSSKQKIEDYIKNYMINNQNIAPIAQNIPPI